MLVSDPDFGGSERRFQRQRPTLYLNPRSIDVFNRYMPRSSRVNERAITAPTRSGPCTAPATALIGKGTPAPWASPVPCSASHCALMQAPVKGTWARVSPIRLVAESGSVAEVPGKVRHRRQRNGRMAHFVGRQSGRHTSRTLSLGETIWETHLSIVIPGETGFPRGYEPGQKIWLIATDPACMRCPYALFCGGGCRSAELEWSDRSQDCKDVADLVQRGVREAYRIWAPAI